LAARDRPQRHDLTGEPLFFHLLSLDYLNNPMSKGKTYCKNTSVRGGWQSVACETTK